MYWFQSFHHYNLKFTENQGNCGIRVPKFQKKKIFLSSLYLINFNNAGKNGYIVSWGQVPWVNFSIFSFSKANFVILLIKSSNYCPNSTANCFMFLGHIVFSLHYFSQHIFFQITLCFYILLVHNIYASLILVYISLVHFFYATLILGYLFLIKKLFIPSLQQYRIILDHKKKR